MTGVNALVVPAVVELSTGCCERRVSFVGCWPVDAGHLPVEPFEILVGVDGALS